MIQKERMLEPFCTDFGNLELIILEFLKQEEECTMALPFLGMAPKGLAIRGLAGLPCQSLTTDVGDCQCRHRRIAI